MALPAKQQVTYWGLVSFVFLLALWFLGDIMLPFIVGGAIAYGLDPLADRLEARGLSRAIATTLISLFALFIFLLAVGLVIPLLVEQTLALIRFAPELFIQLRDGLTARFPQLIDVDSTVVGRSAVLSFPSVRRSKHRAVHLHNKSHPRLWASSTRWCLSSLCRSWHFIYCSTGTEWLPKSMTCCRAITRQRSVASRLR